MSVAFFPGSGIKEPGNSKRFRGKGLPYWIEKIFSRVDFPVEGDIGKTGDFDFLFLFHPGKFPVVSREGIEKIMSVLGTLDPNGSCLLTLEGYPLFILSFYTYKQLKIEPADETLFLELQEHKELRPLSLDECCRTLDIHRDTLEIENRVVAIQAEMLAAGGVIIEDFNHFYMEGLPQVGKGTTLSTGTVIKGDTRIGENVALYPHSYIENSIISDNCTVLPGCIIRDSELEEGVQIGPYTHLRNGALVKKGAKMGNFVEMKKSVLGEGSKAMHLAYIGDADVGKNVNIGAGTITCNYDGKNKNKTVLEDNTFIGSGTELVAPVTVRKNSYVAAGSTITEEVPPDSLGVARQKQRNIQDWVKRKRG